MRALLLAALALPLASAGTEAAPDIEDATGDQPATPADIVAAWLEHDPEGLRFTIKTVDGSFPQRHPGYVYYVTFRTGGVRSAAIIGYGSDGRFYGHVGPLAGPEYDRGGIETFANGRVVDLAPDPGRPSRWSGLLPWGAVPGLREGGTLVDIGVGSARYDPVTRAWQGGLDEASTSRAFVVVPAPTLLDAPAVQAGLLAATTLGGAVAGLAFVRSRKERGDVAPAAVPAESAAAPAPIRVDPRG